MSQRSSIRILMLLENSSFPEDSRVLLQARSLTSAGYAMTVIAPTEPGAQRLWEIMEGIQVYRYPAPPEWGGVLGYLIEYSYSLLMQFMLTIWIGIRHGFDTIHMHTPPDMNALIPAFFRCLGKRFVYDLHDLSPELYLAQKPERRGGVLYRLLLWFERFASRTSSMSISTNESQRDRHVERCGVSLDKFNIVRNGPNKAFLRENIQPRKVVNEKDVLVLGYVGVMGSQDGVDYLIRALDCLVRKLARENVRLVLVGSGASVPDLQQLVESLGLSQYVKFTGKVPFSEVPGYIAGFDICCTPDPSNPYNDSCTTIKTMEYMALGKPVVCFETTENMKTAGDAALYAKNNDIAEYAALLNELVEKSTLRAELGQRGRQRIQSELAWDLQARRLVAAYDRLHQRPSRSWWNSAVTHKETAMSGRGALAGEAPINLGVSDRDPSAQGLSGDVRVEPQAQFAFEGPVGKVLREHFNRDMAQARLTWKFRLYYHLRPWLAKGIRQSLQRSRTRSLCVADDWFIPNEFISDLKAAIRAETGEVSGEHLPRQEVAELHPWPDGQRYALALTHDIEGAEVWSRVRQIAEIEESLGLRSAWYVVPHLYKIDYGLLDELRQRGHEVGIHGYNHDGRLFLSHGIFRRRVPYINAAARALSASGFRAPMVHRNLNWMQELDFDYDASCFDIDPFQPMSGGVGGFWPFIVGKLVELPYTLPQDHTLMVTLGQPACETWLRKLAVIKRFSGLAMLITHPDYLNSADRMDQYRQFCEQVAADSDKWSALPCEVATWWRQRQATVIGDDGQLVGPAADRGRLVSQRTLLDA